MCFCDKNGAALCVDDEVIVSFRAKFKRQIGNCGQFQATDRKQEFLNELLPSQVEKVKPNWEWVETTDANGNTAWEMRKGTACIYRLHRILRNNRLYWSDHGSICHLDLQPAKDDAYKGNRQLHNLT